MMARRIIILILFIPLISLGQDFRKMSFGESVENLTEKNPDINFEVAEADGVEIVAHEDNIAGITTIVAYIFQDKKLVSGVYTFETDIVESDEALKNYKFISERLNAKYKMEDGNNWHKDSWKNQPNYHGHALYMGDVDFMERHQGENKIVQHSISKAKGELLHIVLYMTPEFETQKREQNWDDF